MMIPRRLRTALCAVALAMSAIPAHAQLTIDMTKPSFEPVPIAIVDFGGDAVGAEMANVIRNDLQNSGLFRSIPPSSFIQQNINANAAPRFFGACLLTTIVVSAACSSLTTFAFSGVRASESSMIRRSRGRWELKVEG